YPSRMLAVDAILAISSALSLCVRYFASVSNHPGDNLGLADAGEDEANAIHELRDLGIEAIGEALRLRPTLRIFADSGAFSEVGFPNGVPTIERPIGTLEWMRRLDLYRDIAAVAGEQLYVVAPDCIAHQAETLYRMSAY